MKCTSARLLLASLAPLLAQCEVTSYTIGSGGGSSSGGGFVVRGTISQLDASSSHGGGDFDLAGGFWSGAIGAVLSGYGGWAAQNIPVGFDSSFGGDWNQDGLPNGFTYVFDPDGIEQFGIGILTAPPDPVPSDVNILYETSDDMQLWDLLFQYEAGILTFADPSVMFHDGMVIHDTGSNPRRFYRYGVELLP